ncbi:MAG: hypothetical protein PVI30_06555 [Myxococcales bacterium]|jgi:hypothetical protein
MIRRGEIAAHAAVTAAVAATFARALPYPLQRSWDDGRFIVDNPDVHEVGLRALRSILGGPHFQAYHPLHLLSYWLDVPWAGATGPVLHATSLLLWVLAANLLLRAMRGLGLGVAAATVATLACALHPVQVEVVSWATGRKDVLALLLASATVLCHLRARTEGDRFAWLARLCFALAALSKTTVLPLPAVLWSADVLLRGRRPGEALRMQLPALAIAAALAAPVVLIWRDAEMVRTSAGGLLHAPARMASTWSHLLQTALWPDDNAPMYSTRAVAAPEALDWVLALALLLAPWLALRLGARRAAFSTLAFLLLSLPVSNAIPMYFPFQDRYLSLPLVALGFGLGSALEALPAPGARRAGLLTSCALLAALALRTVQYQGEWRSELSLWGHAVSTQPDAYYAWMKLGEVRRDAGDLDGAVRAYRQMVALRPQLELGHLALLQAVALRDEAVRGLSPSRAQTYVQQYRAALGDPDALRALAARMLGSGHLRSLELPLARALSLRPEPDAVLERAAARRFASGQPSVGLFYLRQMKTPTENPRLRALGRRAAAAQADGPL